ncbi:uncharacterized protein MELLADRAFT_114144 [Melampsora larici-populina 98AG31]|uniref:Uncharacterized protein n=1 Tax=Melampsora larici-populina (strain 98AG31 / pathotype 3-4-7) TaxID=747676 RepID=F4SCB8_MELLP|nr:uncharacterized protein MELLADRAFT_114144 [Melampsora larici-populina 98AG31]EGF97695.1 hypothetical protein MELLADRAFT_114144 [Melampsora larici-populina 98AG31]
MNHPVKQPVIVYSVFNVTNIVPGFSHTQLCDLPEAQATFGRALDSAPTYEWGLSLLPDSSVPFYVNEPGQFNLSGHFLPLGDYPQPILYYDSHSSGRLDGSFIGEDRKPRRVCTSSSGVVVRIEDVIANNLSQTRVVIRHTDYSYLDRDFRTFNVEYLCNWHKVRSGFRDELVVGRVVEISGTLCGFNHQTHLWRILATYKTVAMSEAQEHRSNWLNQTREMSLIV